MELGYPSGLHLEVIPVGRICCPLNVFDYRAVSLGRVLRSGILPYPRYMSSSLAPEWFWVRVEMELKMVSTISMPRKHFTWSGEPFHNFDFIFSRLEPFRSCRVNFVDKLRVFDMV